MARPLKIFLVVVYCVAFCIMLYLLARVFGEKFWVAVLVVWVIPAAGWLLKATASRLQIWPRQFARAVVRNLAVGCDIAWARQRRPWRGGMMTLQELLNAHGVSREELMHLEDPEISNDAFCNQVQLEHMTTRHDFLRTKFYRVSDPGREYIYALVEPNAITIIERSEGFSEPLRLLEKAKRERQFHLLKMSALVFLLLVGLSFLHDVWHRRFFDFHEMILGAVLTSIGFVLIWSEWKK